MIDRSPDERRPGSPEEEGIYWCDRCGAFVHICDEADHMERHWEWDSLEESHHPRETRSGGTR